MRKLTTAEANLADSFFDKDRMECIACPYTAKVKYKIICGMVHFDCMVSKPVCLDEESFK